MLCIWSGKREKLDLTLLKRKWIVISIFFFLLCMTGCVNDAGKGSVQYLLDEKFSIDRYLSAYDVKQEYAESNMRVIEHESVYYMVMADYLWYYDEVSGVSGKLCGKPECDHNNESCNAYIIGPEIQIYDGHIYWISWKRDQIYRADLNGENREVVRSIKYATGVNIRFYIHRGYLYISGFKRMVEDGESYGKFYVLQYVLEGNEDGKELYSGKYLRSVAYYTCRFIGNKMYLIIDYNEDGTFVEYQRKYLVYDIGSGEWTKLIEEESVFRTRSVMISGDVIDVMELRREEDGQRSMRRCKYSAINGEKIDESDVIMLEELYSGLGAVGEYMLLYEFTDDQTVEESDYMILDNEGNLIKRGKIEGRILQYVGSDGENAYFYQYYWDFLEEGVKDYLKLIKVSATVEGEDEVLLMDCRFFDK